MYITLHHHTRKALECELKIAQIEGNLKYYQRLQALILLNRRLPLEDVAALVLRHVRTLYHWIALLFRAGPRGLRPASSPGRKPRLTVAQKKELKTLILQGPEACGFDTGRWTAAVVQTLIFRRFGVEYAVKYIPQLLASLHLSCKRVEAFSFREDPEAQRLWKVERFPALVRQAQREGAAILFEDESTFRMWSRTSYSWGETGKPLRCPVFMNNVYQKVFGAIDLATGRFLYRRGSSLKGEQFVAFLKHLLTRYTCKVYLVVDNGSSHKGAAVRAFLELNAHRIELVRLPTYSPGLNPIEKVWKQIKQDKLHNRFFESRIHFQAALSNALSHFQRNPETVQSILHKWTQRSEAARAS
jgi:putative transposase